MSDKHPLVQLYGEGVFDQVLEKVKELAINSNIPFDKNYCDLGMSFLMMKAKQIVNEEKEKCNLQSLIGESFGEAAIYKYNVNG